MEEVRCRRAGGSRLRRHGERVGAARVPTDHRTLTYCPPVALREHRAGWVDNLRRSRFLNYHVGRRPARVRTPTRLNPRKSAPYRGQ